MTDERSRISLDAEYSSLRGEITARIGVSYQIAIFAYTAAAAIWALFLQFGMGNLDILLWPTMFGIPVWICLFAGKLMNQNTLIISEIASYIYTFYESEPVYDGNGKLTAPAWEHIHNLRRNENKKWTIKSAFKDPYRSIITLWILVLVVSLIPILIYIVCWFSIDADVLIFNIDTDHNPMEYLIGIVAYVVAVVLPSVYIRKEMWDGDVYDKTYGNIEHGWDDITNGSKK